ncbi:MAG: S8/S53 family peptidase [Planctomycetota bacterium]
MLPLFVSATAAVRSSRPDYVSVLRADAFAGRAETRKAVSDPRLVRQAVELLRGEDFRVTSVDRFSVTFAAVPSRFEEVFQCTLVSAEPTGADPGRIEVQEAVDGILDTSGSPFAAVLDGVVLGQPARSDHDDANGKLRDAKDLYLHEVHREFDFSLISDLHANTKNLAVDVNAVADELASWRDAIDPEPEDGEARRSMPLVSVIDDGFDDGNALFRGSFRAQPAFSDYVAGQVLVEDSLAHVPEILQRLAAVRDADTARAAVSAFNRVVNFENRTWDLVYTQLGTGSRNAVQTSLQGAVAAWKSDPDSQDKREAVRTAVDGIRRDFGRAQEGLNALLSAVFDTTSESYKQHLFRHRDHGLTVLGNLLSVFPVGRAVAAHSNPAEKLGTRVKAVLRFDRVELLRDVISAGTGGPHVICCSWNSGEEPPAGIAQALDAKSNTLLLVSSGNSTLPGSETPTTSRSGLALLSAHPRVLAVGGARFRDGEAHAAPLTNAYEGNETVVPQYCGLTDDQGGAVLTPFTKPDGQAAWALAAGSSIATPHIAGVCALIWSITPSASAADVVKILEQGSRQIVQGSFWDPTRQATVEASSLRTQARIPSLIEVIRGSHRHAAAVAGAQT